MYTKILSSMGIKFFSNQKNTLLFIGFYIFVYVFLFYQFSNFDIHNKYGDAQSLMNVYVYGSYQEPEDQVSLMPKVPQISDGVCCIMKSYSGFPPLMNWFGKLFNDLGFELISYRLMLALVFALAIFVFAGSVDIIFNRSVAILTLLSTLILTPVWKTGITQIYNLGDLMLWGMIYVVFKSGADIKKNVFFSFIGLFLIASITYEYVLFALIVVTVAGLRYNFKLSFFLGLSGSIGAFLSIVIKFLIDAYDKGSLAIAFSQQINRILFRMTESNSSISSIDKIIGGIHAYPGFLWTSFERHYFSPFYAIGLFITGYFIINIDRYAKGKETLVAIMSLPTLLVASFSWTFVFFQHSVIHINSIVNRHWIYFVALLLGVSIYYGIKQIREIVTSKAFFKPMTGLFLVHCVFIASVVVHLSNDLASFRKIALNQTWEKEVQQIRSICGKQDDEICTLPNKTLMRAAFLHQNEEFKLGAKKFKISEE